MKITATRLEAIQEPLKAAFAFKGKYSAYPMWNTVVQLRDDEGHRANGYSNQGILWSDAAVYNRFSSTGGNALMYLMSEYARKRAEGMEFDRPDHLLAQLLPDVWKYGEAVAGMPIRETFALNSLVALDTAAWLLYAQEKGISGFDELIPAHAREAMSARNERIAAIPLITYSASIADILQEVSQGCFFLKIKIGSDPEKDGDREKMLIWDMERLRSIHEALKDHPCRFSENGHIPYYLDANGRYDSKDRLMRFMEYADRIGALERIVLLEEPFPEGMEVDLSDIPVRLAADESAHSDQDVIKRIHMGYRAIALKPIAKTMSMSFDMLHAAGAQNIPCFCADLTVNPWMVDLNKNFAARLPAIPGLKVGVLESNGHQYYARWEEMERMLPYPSATWIRPQNGMYELDQSFYEKSGGIFDRCPLYESAIGE